MFCYTVPLLSSVSIVVKWPENEGALRAKLCPGGRLSVECATRKLPQVGPGSMVTPVSFYPAFGERVAPLLRHLPDKAKGRTEMPYLYTHTHIPCQVQTAHVFTGPVP